MRDLDRTPLVGRGRYAHVLRFKRKRDRAIRQSRLGLPIVKGMCIHVHDDVMLHGRNLHMLLLYIDETHLVFRRRTARGCTDAHEKDIATAVVGKSHAIIVFCRLDQRLQRRCRNTKHV